ncbi:glycine-rich RNA-binding protein 3, mitochondrial isoform X2 [Ceratitis capitata]|uniref:glycine-rich RNA-binding protein 3, mitochondrial isoform X2 n=1 Tax=Ceratitis capitata TaxID=7213 RepID=UPI00061889EC|nr:glycine-rich RNA-binding protein 3, mitochondrial isoform X2 [Ceratitis capitata]
MATTKIFVGSLPPGTKPEELRHLFEDYGVVVECDVMNRCGFVHMETKEMANTAITALNAIEFKGQIIVVELGRPKDKKPSGDKTHGGRDRDMSSRGGSRGSAARGGGNRNSGPGNRGGGMGGRDGGMIGAGNARPNFGNAGGRGGQKNKFNQNVGPIRNDNFNQQRNMPYQRRNPQNAIGSSGTFGGNQRGNFNSPSIGGSRRFGPGGIDANQNFHNQEGQIAEGNGHYSGGMNHFNDNEGGFGNNLGGNFSGNFGGTLSGGFGGAPNKVLGAQDRRGFALSTGGRGGSQRFGSSGDTGGRFGGTTAGAYGGMQNTASDGLFSRRNNHPNNSVTNLHAHGGFQSGFGGGRSGDNPNFRGRGGFRRGGGASIGPGGGGGSNHESFPAPSNYNSNFPPLGVPGVGRGRGGGGRGVRGGGIQRRT